MMDNQDLKKEILSLISDADFADTATPFLYVTIYPDKIRPLAEMLYHKQKMAFDYLFCLTGVDWESYFMVVYHLNSTKLHHSLVVKVKIEDIENPSVNSVCDIWKTAEFHEREIYDLFGIKFINHPDMRRILLDENWKGYPLRKNYVDEVNIVEL